ncbi:unnamed protein product [Rangifer tarandus platyrhynchus]|uniref:Uncharacterized protein n=2 Tax=Rangifer tarandus platyrhynchus TaxID=3082113 RepID=A0AC59ZKH6_RANTA|nr:unnamed protein product [Rangifer tarandus platyrhynchus]
MVLWLQLSETVCDSAELGMGLSAVKVAEARGSRAESTQMIELCYPVMSQHGPQRAVSRVGTQQLARKPALRPEEIPGRMPGGNCGAGCSKPLHGDPVTSCPGGCLLQGSLLRLTQSPLSRRRPRLAALADAQGGKTAWPWQLPARKEPTGAREKPFPCPLQEPW